MSDLTRVEAAAAGLDSYPSLEETADYLGRLDKIIRTLAAHRRTIMSEVSGPTAGREYRITEERYCDRSYNTRLLLDAFARNGVMWTDLVDEDALRLTWQWTALRNAAIRHDIGLRIAGHEIGEDEADFVGEVWRSRFKVEGVKDE
jgi:hypothetical protein